MIAIPSPGRDGAGGWSRPGSAVRTPDSTLCGSYQPVRMERRERCPSRVRTKGRSVARRDSSRPGPGKTWSTKEDEMRAGLSPLGLFRRRLGTRPELGANGQACDPGIKPATGLALRSRAGSSLRLPAAGRRWSPALFPGAETKAPETTTPHRRRARRRLTLTCKRAIFII